jgi:hypothetical protein
MQIKQLSSNQWSMCMWTGLSYKLKFAEYYRLTVIMQKFHLGWLLIVKKNIKEIPMKATSWNQSQEDFY